MRHYNGQKVEKYSKRKTYIRNKSKTKLKQTTKEQPEELFGQGRKKVKGKKSQVLQVSRVQMPRKV